MKPPSPRCAERRSCTRHPIRNVRAHCDTGYSIETYTVADVSAAGVRLTCGPPLHAGREVRFWLRGRTHSMALRGTVVWNRPAQGEVAIALVPLHPGEHTLLETISGTPLESPPRRKRRCLACGDFMRLKKRSPILFCDECAASTTEPDLPCGGTHSP